MAQPPDAISAVRAEVAKASSPLALVALASTTALSGSALIALALARGLNPDAPPHLNKITETL